ncbi:MAG: hypothetical protein K9N40_12875 [Candidatus Cloacimonetes bacterium]|nr:hypothetical protein [Candidatus Cloacimonadota bacterium]
MKQEEKTIYNFQKGDSITRIKPIIYQDGEKDFTFVGKQLTFMGIANASVYLSKEADMLTSLFTGKDKFTIQLPIETCKTGWADYIEPDFLEEGDELFIDDEEKIKKKINNALSEEDYELAERLKKKLEEIRKNGEK